MITIRLQIFFVRACVQYNQITRNCCNMTNRSNIRRIGGESRAYLAGRMAGVVEIADVLTKDVPERAHTHTHGQVLSGDAERVRLEIVI